MTQNLFTDVCTAIWGDTDWKPIAADTLGVQLRNVQYWAAGTKEIPDGVMRDLKKIVKSAITEAVEDQRRLLVADLALHVATAHTEAPKIAASSAASMRVGGSFRA